MDEVLLGDGLREKGLLVERQKPIPICFRGQRFGEGFRADLLVEDFVLVELRSVEALARVQRKQVLTYLRLTNLRNRSLHRQQNIRPGCDPQIRLLAKSPWFMRHHGDLKYAPTNGCRFNERFPKVVVF